jgi:hypothetical protein
MRMCDFGGGVYLLKFIHLRAPYIIFGYLGASPTTLVGLDI